MKSTNIFNVLILSILLFSSHADAQRKASGGENPEGRNFAVGIGLLGGIIMNAMSQPLSAGSPPVKLWIAMQSMNSYRSEYERRIEYGRKTGAPYFETLQQWACNKGLSGDSHVPLNKYTFETVANSPEAMRAPANMTLEQCVVILGGRVEDMDTPAKSQSREQTRLIALAEAKAAAEAAEIARVEAKSKADQEAKIAAEEAARKFEEERPAREAAQRKADADLKAFNERIAKEAKEREAAQKVAEAKRIDGLRNGTVPVTGLDDIKIKHGDANMPNGAQFGSAPKVQADGKRYFIAGTIRQSDDSRALIEAVEDDNAALATAFMRAQGLEARIPKYIYANFPRGKIREQYLQDAKIGGKTLVIARYVSNSSVELVNGAHVQVPVFEVEAVYQ